MDTLLSGNTLPRIGAVVGLLIAVASLLMDWKHETPHGSFTVYSIGFPVGIILSLYSGFCIS